jgi:hypothetical protein
VLREPGAGRPLCWCLPRRPASGPWRGRLFFLVAHAGSVLRSCRSC